MTKTYWKKRFKNTQRQTQSSSNEDRYSKHMRLMWRQTAWVEERQTDTHRETDSYRPPTEAGFLVWSSAHTTLIHLLICLGLVSPCPRKWHNTSAIHPTTYCLQSPRRLLTGLSVSSRRLNPSALCKWMLNKQNPSETYGNKTQQMSFIKALKWQNVHLICGVWGRKWWIPSTSRN